MRRRDRFLQRDGPMNSESFSVPEALRFGWDSFKRNIAPSIALAFTSIAVMFVLNGLTQAVQRHGTLSLGLTLITQVAQVFFAFFWLRLALTVYDGREVHARDLLPDGASFLNYLAVSLLYGILVTAGLVLLVVPGLYLAVRYGLATFLVADGRTTDVLGAFRQSSELTRGRRWHLFGLGVVLVAVNFAGAILFGVGLLVTIPVTAFASALVYRRLATRTVHDAYVAGPPSPMAV
jgi:uncharacterized membrane protein